MQIVQKKFSTPPGGLVIWIFILAEFIVFSMALTTFIISRNGDLQNFELARQVLNQHLALVNTLTLFTSGALVALAVDSYGNSQIKKSSNLFFLAALLGLLFLIFKGVEYSQKWGMDLSAYPTTFFDYYWALTLFHALHVLLGIFILVAAGLYIRFGKKFELEDFNHHTAANYWHMCDLIWIIVYAVIYLL